MKYMDVGRFKVPVLNGEDELTIDYCAEVMDCIICGLDAYPGKKISYERAGYLLIEEIVANRLSGLSEPKRDMLLYVNQQDKEYIRLMSKMNTSLSGFLQIANVAPSGKARELLNSFLPYATAIWIWEVMRDTSEKNHDLGNLDGVCDSCNLSYPMSYDLNCQNYVVKGRTNDAALEPYEYIRDALVAFNGYLKGEGTSEVSSKKALKGEEYEAFGICITAFNDDITFLHNGLGLINKLTWGADLTQEGITSAFVKLCNNDFESVNFEDVRDEVKGFNGDVTYVDFIESLGKINSVTIDKGKKSSELFMKYMRKYVRACLNCLYLALVRYLLQFSSRNVVSMWDENSKISNIPASSIHYSRALSEFINSYYPDDEDSKGSVFSDIGASLVEEDYFKDVNNIKTAFNTVIQYLSFIK